MSGNPRWMYQGDGDSRQPKDYSSLLAEILAATANESRERNGSRELRDRGRGSGSGAGVGVRVPAAK